VDPSSSLYGNDPRGGRNLLYEEETDGVKVSDPVRLKYSNNPSVLDDNTHV